MVLFDMVFSLFFVNDGQLQNNSFSDLFPKRRRVAEISWKLPAEITFILAAM